MTKNHNLLNVETKLNFLCLPDTKQRIFLHKKSFLGKGGLKEGLNKKQKERFLTALAMTIKKGPTSVRKHANELEDHEKAEDSN